MTKIGSVFPVVLCGGSGTRLWPVSRRSHPKQFTAMLDGETLFQRTLSRIRGRGLADPLLMTHSDFRFVVAEQLSQMEMNASRIVVEPEGRNTAPAIAMAARVAAEMDPEAVLLVLPSDHVVRDADAFHTAVLVAVEAAGLGALVTFGIRPEQPETGYGYIELPADSDGDGAQPFTRFVEKPDRDAAEQMVASGRYLWNSGMFVFPAAKILQEMERHAPAVLRATDLALREGEEDLDFFRPDAAAYAASPDISIDYAVMEQTEGMVVPVDCGWNDLGTWKTVWQELGGGAVTSGNALAIDCENALLRSDERDMAMVGIGLSGIVAVATRDAVLVADMSRAQDVRLAVDALKEKGAAQATEFPRCHRPWGWYETLSLGHRFQVKQIMVTPGGQLSLQSHVHRAEHWVVVAGTARVTVGEEVRLLTENQSTYIPLGAVHRLENPGKVPLRLIEVQSGVYLGEDDIIRYDDVYARA